MNPAGIVRRVDDLGRIVLPKEVRRAFRIKEGSPIEIITCKDGIMLKRYSVEQELSNTIDELLEYQCNWDRDMESETKKNIQRHLEEIQKLIKQESE